MWLTAGLSLMTAAVLMLPVVTFAFCSWLICLMRWHRF